MIEVPVLFGPTASGKSRLALEVASMVGRVEIVSADSRQIYIGMDVGTAKPSRADRDHVRHHCIDIIKPTERYSAGAYALLANDVIHDIVSRGSIPFLVGGTGFYVRALFHGLDAPLSDPSVEAAIWARANEVGFDVIARELSECDPVSASSIDPENKVRVVRALACYHHTGRAFSSFRSPDSGNTRLRARILVLAPPRPLLYEAINRRFERMVDEGLIEETRRLAEIFGDAAHALQGVGYREALGYLKGSLTLDRLLELGKQETRRYAKRQYTWIRGMDDTELVRGVDASDATQVARWIGGLH